MKSFVPRTIAILLTLYGAAALAGKPHIHGIGTLQLVLESNHLHVELSLSATDVVGFEHAPRTTEQRDAVTKAVALLKDSSHVIEPPATAGCATTPGRVESALLEDQQDYDHDHADGETHADFNVTYRFDCQSPEALSSLKVTLFQRLPRLEKLDVQSVTPGGQRSQQLTPGPASIMLP